MGHGREVRLNLAEDLGAARWRLMRSPPILPLFGNILRENASSGRFKRFEVKSLSVLRGLDRRLTFIGRRSKTYRIDARDSLRPLARSRR
jgi:hypothetical protein